MSADPFIERLTERTQAEVSSGCWLWKGKLRKDGYGQITYGGSTTLAHRAVYTEVHGPIPEGLQLDHLCRNRACVNPEHLEPVTPKVNINRGVRANLLKTHCPQGHEYTPGNTKTDNRGWRTCKICTKDAAKKYRERKEALSV